MSINEAKINRIRSGRPFSIFDIVAISLALILSLSYIIYTLTTRSQGTEVIISVQNGGTFYYSLNEDTIINEDDIGLTKGHIEIVVSNKKVFVRHSDCGNKICIKTGEIMHEGRSITCLPLGVHIRISGALNLVTG